MVEETRLLVEAPNVVSVRITCKACRNAVVLHVENKGYRPDVCPICRERWSHTPDATIPADELISALRRLIDNGDSPIVVQMEIDGG